MYFLLGFSDLPITSRGNLSVPDMLAAKNIVMRSLPCLPNLQTLSFILYVEYACKRQKKPSSSPL